MQHKGQLWWQPYPQVALGWIPAAETQTRRWDAAGHSLYISQGSWLKKNREWPVWNDPWLCHHRYRAIPTGQVSVCICCDHSALFTSDLGSNTLVLQYAYCLLLSASSEVIFRHNMWQTILRDYKHHQVFTFNFNRVWNSGNNPVIIRLFFKKKKNAQQIADYEKVK